MQTYTKMRSRKFPDVIMKVIPGHFVTPNSHINYYIDMTTMRTRQSEAKADQTERGQGGGAGHGQHLRCNNDR